MPSAGEDDGYLLSFVHDETTGCSELAVFSAKTMASAPVARIKLPQRVRRDAVCWSVGCEREVTCRMWRATCWAPLTLAHICQRCLSAPV